VNTHATDFFDAMIMPIPPEMSQVNVPVLVRSGVCAWAALDIITVAPSPTIASAAQILFIRKSP
jgi:hypothetical protein